MPVGQTFEIARRRSSPTTSSASSRTAVPLTSRRRGRAHTSSSRPPCESRSSRSATRAARIGALMRLEFHPYAIVPIPRGFRNHALGAAGRLPTLTAQSGS
jgi:hypothetical protein